MYLKSVKTYLNGPSTNSVSPPLLPPGCRELEEVTIGPSAVLCRVAIEHTLVGTLVGAKVGGTEQVDAGLPTAVEAMDDVMVVRIGAMKS